MQKIIAIVGLPGSGKTEVAEYLKNKFKAGYVRLGQLVLDEIKRRKIKPTEQNERGIREHFRKMYGMAAFAKLNFSKIDQNLKKGKNCIVDGLYSWAEYLEFLKKYENDLVVVAVFSSPETRYSRLKDRAEKHGKDKDLKFRSFDPESARARDYAQIENLDQAGPIAMANFTIVNEKTKKDLIENLDEIIKKIKV